MVNGIEFLNQYLQRIARNQFLKIKTTTAFIEKNHLSELNNKAQVKILFFSTIIT